MRLFWQFYKKNHQYQQSTQSLSHDFKGNFYRSKRADKRVAVSIEILMGRSGARPIQEMRRGLTRRVFRPHVATLATLVQAQTGRYSKFSPF